MTQNKPITRRGWRSAGALALLALLSACATQPAAPKPQRPVVMTQGNCPPPSYPKLAQRLNLEGALAVRLVVDLQGTVTLAEVLSSAVNPSQTYTDAQKRALLEMDQAALDAMKRCKFEAVSDAHSFAVVRVPIRFKLE